MDLTILGNLQSRIIRLPCFLRYRMYSRMEYYGVLIFNGSTIIDTTSTSGRLALLRVSAYSRVLHSVPHLEFGLSLDCLIYE